ncbi:APC family permease [Georgenia sp. Z1491]|uniref:APC family permease n=1 Tax=Georgenia sp. Z1491 TaxID=3416707 RepID=UPI003CE81BE4
MPDLASALKRLVVGRPVRTERLGGTLLPKRLALPVFASDALSSVAYAPDEILLTLALAGVAATALSPAVGLAVVVVMVVVVLSYRQTVRAYPSGGGGYEVVTTNLGRRAGRGVGSALLVDYLLTVAVSVSSGVQYLASAVPPLQPYRVPIAALLVAALALLNLRGTRESGRVIGVPFYLFMASVGVLALVGAGRELLGGGLPDAATASLTVVPDPAHDQALTTLGGAFLVLRAFTSGCAALTGVEAVANGVPTFRRPRSGNAATTLLLLGGISAAMLMSVIWLATAIDVRVVERPAEQLLRDGVPVGAGYHQDPAIVQIADSVLWGWAPVVALVAVVAGAILLLAANTAFTGFPVLASVLARDGLLPRRLHTRGDRLTYSNGILALAAGAAVLVVVLQADVTRLIQLYIVGVFVSFTLTQTGMVRHWRGVLRREHDPALRSAARRSRAINLVGAVLTAVVLVVVLVTKLTRGAWITVLLVAVVFLLMGAVRRHYDDVARRTAVPADAEARSLPARVHAIVLVSTLNQPTARALAYARATRPSSLEAVTVLLDEDSTDELRRRWDEVRVPVPLTVLDAPFRDVTEPVLEHVRAVRRASPREIVVVYIPEYVAARVWYRLLHNGSARRLLDRLRLVPGVVVATVPFQLARADEVGGQEVARD